MTTVKVSINGELAMVTLPRNIVEELGIKDGDELNVAVVEKTILLRAASKMERSELIQQATDKVFDKYDDAFAVLAEDELQTNHEERLGKISRGLLERREDVYKALSKIED